MSNTPNRKGPNRPGVLNQESVSCAVPDWPDDDYEVVIRPLRNTRNQQDLKAIALIDQKSYSHSWSWQDLAKLMQENQYAVLVAYRAQQVVGYLVYANVKRKFQIINITVHPEFRRRKVGTDLVSALLAYCAQVQKTFVVFTEVQERNLIAQVFFRSLRFKWKQTFKGNFSENDEDTYLLSLRIPEKSV